MDTPAGRHPGHRWAPMGAMRCADSGERRQDFVVRKNSTTVMQHGLAGCTHGEVRSGRGASQRLTCVWRITDFPRISNSPHTGLRPLWRSAFGDARLAFEVVPAPVPRRLCPRLPDAGQDGEASDAESRRGRSGWRAIHRGRPARRAVLLIVCRSWRQWNVRRGSAPFAVPRIVTFKRVDWEQND